MNDTQITTLEQIKSILEFSSELVFVGQSRKEKYSWIESVLKRFDYFNLPKKDKGLVKSYLERMSGFSRAQITRLIEQNLLKGEIKLKPARRNRFCPKYTNGCRDLRPERFCKGSMRFMGINASSV